MILEGVKLMIVGMSIVYIFLIILMGLIVLSSKIFKENPVPTVTNKNIKPEKNNDLITVISTAVSVYRSRKIK